MTSCLFCGKHAEVYNYYGDFCERCDEMFDKSYSIRYDNESIADD